MRRLLFAAALLSAALAPPDVAGQETPLLRVLGDRQRAYDAAKEQYQADSVAFQAIRYEWDRLTDQLGAALARGEDGEIQQLSGQLEELTGEVTRLEYKWLAAREDWKEKGEWLAEALNNYLGMLDTRIESGSGSDNEATNLYNEYERQLEKLEEELPQEQPELEPMRAVKYRPGDGPSEIRLKRSVLQTRIDDFTALLAKVDRDIEALVRRQKWDQRRRDDRARRDVFGDDEIPTVGGRTGVTGEAVVADTTAAGLVLKPLEVRIAEKKELRDRVAAYLEDLERQLEEFERDARIGR